MEHPLMYVFDDFDTAQKARAELIQYGFSNDAVELRISDDEAGPVQGNFTVGDATHATPGHDYSTTFGTVAHRGNCMLMIAPSSPTHSQYAIALMARYGVSDPGAPVAPAAPASPAP
jgi:hypothetical protein